MIIFFRALFIRKRKNNKTLQAKVEFLKKAGLNIAVIDKNDKYKNGYILGKMRDNHIITHI